MKTNYYDLIYTALLGAGPRKRQLRFLDTIILFSHFFAVKTKIKLKKHTLSVVPFQSVFFIFFIINAQWPKLDWESFHFKLGGWLKDYIFHRSWMGIPHWITLLYNQISNMANKPAYGLAYI